MPFFYLPCLLHQRWGAGGESLLTGVLRCNGTVGGKNDLKEDQARKEKRLICSYEYCLVWCLIVQWKLLCHH